MAFLIGLTLFYLIGRYSMALIAYLAFTALFLWLKLTEPDNWGHYSVLDILLDRQPKPTRSPK